MCECRHQIPKSALTEAEIAGLREAGRYALGFGIYNDQQLGLLLLERKEAIDWLREHVATLEDRDTGRHAGG